MQDKIVVIECDRCKTKIVGIKQDSKLIKATCNVCGSKNIYQRLSLRHYRVDVYLPFEEKLY